MNNLKSNFTKEQQVKAIKKFLEIKTNHDTECMKIRKGIKSDFSVTLNSGAKVNFWFQEDMLYYGLIGYGIFSAAQVDKLMKPENNKVNIDKGNLIDFMRITRANSGCTFNLNTSEINPRRGYAVALKGMEVTMPVGRFNDDSVVDFINKNVDFLSRNRFFIGSWISDNKVYLDVVEIHENIEDAVRDGMKNDQLAIFDCKKQVEIKLPKRQKSGTLTQNKSYNDAAALKVIQEIKSI